MRIRQADDRHPAGGLMKHERMPMLGSGYYERAGYKILDKFYFGRY